MAEGFEEEFSSLIRTTSMTYLILRDAYKALPLPIVLPVEYAAHEGIEEFHRVMIDAADRIEDLPVDGVAGQLLAQATYHWISATAVMRMYALFRFATYAQAAKWNIVQAFEEADLAKAMLEQQD